VIHGRHRGRALWLALAGLLLYAPGAQAQAWTAGVSAGQTVFDPVGTRIGTAHLAGSLRYDTRRDVWVSGIAAVPIRGDDPFWSMAGLGARVPVASSRSRHAAFGVDLAGHGYVFHDRLQSTTGSGGTLEVMPVAHVQSGAARLDLRAGWRGQTLDYSGLTERRGVLDAGARVSYGRSLRAAVDTRLVRATEGTFPFVGGTLSYRHGGLEAWTGAGRWLSSTLDDVTWQAGAGYRAGTRVTLWTSVRQDGRDPLYWNASRRSWSVGLSTRLGRVPAAGLLPRREAGLVVIRVPAADAPGPSLTLAGSFSNWQAVPMIREGNDWVARLSLDPGIYRYAFRDAGGRWFVPRTIEGRRSDDMGGEVALLVVEP
jgi:hypothetical protein